ncbi:Protein of unknown function [Psychrobacillus sp. OK028]|uniref:DUF1672 family protein n=1 Tax=Psychrobacillus sp. OK028 TaxID=1884359 RepID=UPI00088C1059|nr:DUF1672 family protein [Psychrobacillus sp. OK028]SDN72017.1 Protein of unknown function [Psychrobacillus sp. OK028]
MLKNKKVMAFGLLITVLLGGCNIEKDIAKRTDIEMSVRTNQKDGITLNTENLVRVQEYNGEGYALRNGEKTDKIAEDNREDIEVAVKKFFMDKYKTDVLVHNLVGNKDGVTVFVESVGEPHFHAVAIVPIDVNNNTIETDKMFTQAGQVEDALASGLYAMAYEEEIENLNNFVEQISKDYSLIGKNKEAIQNVGGTGFLTPFYFISSIGETFDKINSLYLENQNVDRKELRSILDYSKFNPDDVNIVFNVFMKDGNTEPDEKVYDEISNMIETSEGFPRGSYSLLMHDNLINSKYGSGSKGNTINKHALNEIMKE